MPATKPYVVTIEEHYADADIFGTWTGYDAAKTADTQRKLIDLGDERIAEMDAVGIDFQVISHGAPAVQKLDAATATRMARAANDRLAEAVRAHPTRFGAFAILPTPDPAAAADELERAVTKLGFLGAMVHGLTGNRFIDDKRFWPIFERAQALEVPIYMHPAVPHQAVIDAYFSDYVGEWPMLIRAAWGYGMETATAGIRIVLSGVLDAYPGTKIILGHMGEGLPFYLWRINQALARNKFVEKSFREYFTEHFWITTSGFFSNPALQCSITEMGIDRILYSVDYPFVDNALGAAWLDNLPLCAEDRVKFLGGTARKLLRLP
jgi:predicted TIM-barrel fold metal-dependent hydrolase